MKINQKRFVEEKNKMRMQPVNFDDLKVGKWRNVTREQIVTVLNIYPHAVEYFYDGSCLPLKIHTKSKEHFLRSYIKIK
jgi:hypothetical protein